MSKCERETIQRAQKHGWTVSFVDDTLTIMELAFTGAKRHILFVWPNGKCTAQVKTV